MRLALAGVLLLSTACFTPVPEQCKSKRCLADGGNANACSVGSTRECGSAIGICKVGRQTCGTGGTWGRCTGGVEAGVEVCDGKDNNCDGVVDEGVGKMCPLQKGVCAGAAGACGGGDGGCEQAYGSAYEVVETKCDGLDNDCDGVVDRSAPINLSQSPGVVSRNAVAVKAPGADAVIVLYEEGQKIAARVLRADGTISDAVAPSVTVEASTRSFAPALGVNGTMVVAAWVEEVAATTRVMVASLDPTTGRSDLMANGALLAMTTTMPTEVAVAVDQAAARLALAVVDNTGLRLRGFSSTLPPPMGSPSFAHDPLLAGCRRVSIFPLGGGAFTMGFEDGRMLRARVDAAGGVIFSGQQPMGRDSHLFGTDGGMTSVFLGGTGASKSLFTGQCVPGGSQLSCTDSAALTAPSDANAMRVADARLAAWEQGVASPQVVQTWLDRVDAGVIGPGRRPAPVLTSGQVVLFFDTESVVSSTVSTDEIYVLKTCR